ncbi:MAG: lipid-A-disaccharide synthase [Hyphomicrobiales bacterium]|nr:lipid-A-disaccharide synthase [Hyphomicrobiales bacterium]
MRTRGRRRRTFYLRLPIVSGAGSRRLEIALIAGEHSGDQLGFKLMGALRQALNGEVGFFGVGGEAMEAEGLRSLFPISDIAVMGIMPVLARLPKLIARIRQAATAIVTARPDALVIIDSPDFTHRVARRVRKARPDLPIVDYVSPSVWAWRQGRAKAMRAYVDCVLALFPFEPAAYVRLSGPRCVYVGHPLIERLDELRPSPDEARRRVAEPPIVAVLPGSRLSEIRRLMNDFGGALRILRDAIGPFTAVLPTLPHIEDEVRARAALWPQAPQIVLGETPKFEAFRNARAALAASGTVTLELALAGVPMVGAYKVGLVEEQLKYLIKVPSILLPNLILGQGAIPEKVQHDCTPAALGAALTDLVRDGPQREAQAQALARLDQLMRLPDGRTPSAYAAGAVLETIAARKYQLREPGRITG